MGEGSPFFCPSLIPRTVPVLHCVSGSPSEGLIFNCKEQSISTFNIVTMLILVWGQAARGFLQVPQFAYFPSPGGEGPSSKHLKSCWHDCRRINALTSINVS